MKRLKLAEILLFLPEKFVGGFVGGFSNRFQFFTVIGCHSLSFRLVNDSTPSVFKKPSYYFISFNKL